MSDDQATRRQCLECGKVLPAPKRTPRGKPVGRARLCCSDTCSKRRRRRAGLEPVPPSPLPAGHLTAAEALVAAFQRQRGSKFSAMDAAQAIQLTSTAAALDSDPTNVSLLKEFRISLGSFAKAFDDSASSGPSLAEFLADALSKSKEK